MRYQVMSKIYEDLDQGITVFDPTSTNWQDFPWEEGYTIHKLTKEEIEKPYLISFKYFNTTDYEDIILLLNNIVDIWQVVPGKQIRIPNLTTLTKFIINLKKQNVQ